MTTVYAPGKQLINPSGEPGALGCIARTVAGHPDGPNLSMVLSGAHVLFADATEQTDVALRTPGSSTAGPVLGLTRGTWTNGFRMAKTRVGGQVFSGAETDCAIARLVPGAQFTNQIPEIGMITGTPPPGSLGVVAGPAFGTPPTPEQYVRFYSPETERVQYGTIIKMGVTGTYVEGGSGVVDPLLYPQPLANPKDRVKNSLPNINQFVILPRPAPTESYKPYLSGSSLRWSQDGDSGSVVVNSANQVIGLVVRNALKPALNETHQEWRAIFHLGVVCPIGKVLEHLKIEIPPSYSGTAPNAGPLDPFAVSVRDADALEQGIDRLRGHAAATRFGQIMMGLIHRHYREVRQILYARRPAVVAWQNNQGPALVHHIVRALRDPEHEIPTLINGVPRAKTLQVADAMLTEFGSPQLRRDLDRHREFLLRHAATLIRLHEIPEILDRVSQERAGTVRQ